MYNYFVAVINNFLSRFTCRKSMKFLLSFNHDIINSKSNVAWPILFVKLKAWYCRCKFPCLQIEQNKHLAKFWLCLLLTLVHFQYHHNQQFDLEVLMNAPSKSSFEWEDIVLGGSEDQRWMTDVARDYVSRVLTFWRWLLCRPSHWTSCDFYVLSLVESALSGFSDYITVH